MRVLWIDGKEYQWKVGRSHVLIRHDDKKVAAPHFVELLGQDMASVERDAWKGNLHIAPADVAGYILSLIRRQQNGIIG